MENLSHASNMTNSNLWEAISDLRHLFSEDHEFGHCPNDYPIFVLLLIAFVFMVFGNSLLLAVATKLFQCSRMDIIVVNQAVVDVFYCLLYPLVILDAKRAITDQNLFIAFKIAEDSLLTLSVLAVLLVNTHKYFYIKCPYSYLTRISARTTLILIVCSWMLTPIGFTIRNVRFVCRRNRECASSFYYCLASDGAGEISSIIFYISSALIILAFNVRLLTLAMKFQNEVSFRRTCSLVDGRKIFKRTSEIRRQRKMRIVVYPLVTSLLILFTITPFWLSMAFCQLKMWCLDGEHSLFYLMRLHSMINPYCTLLTHRKYRLQARVFLVSLLCKTRPILVRAPTRQQQPPPSESGVEPNTVPLQIARASSASKLINGLALRNGSLNRRGSFIDCYRRNAYFA